MPKIVDHHERREQIAAALLRVAATSGLEAVSLRHVAAECGVTAGMVQHYFPTKDAMMTFAMESATARYTARIAAAVEQLGPDPAPRRVVHTLLRTLLPLEESGTADARVTLAFLSYAATRPAVARGVGTDNAELRLFLAEQVRRSRERGAGAAGPDPEAAATALLALTDGLGVQLVSSALAPEAALAALELQVTAILGAG